MNALVDFLVYNPGWFTVMWALLGILSGVLVWSVGKEDR